MRERNLCLAGRLDGGAGTLSYNYALAEDGCPESAARWTARRVPATMPGSVEGDAICP